MLECCDCEYRLVVVQHSVPEKHSGRIHKVFALDYYQVNTKPKH